MNDGDWFGESLASVGDLERAGVGDLAVRAPLDDARGAVWVLFLDGVPATPTATVPWT